MRMVLFVALAAMSCAAVAGEEAEKSRTEAVNILSNCSGFYEFLAVVSETNGKHETAEQFRGSARGAKLSAAYLLSVEAAAKGRLRKLSEFNDYIDNVAVLAKGRMMASREVGDDAAIKEQGETCMAAMELQKALVQEMRNEMIDR